MQSFAAWHIDWWHDGYILANARAVATGQTLYKDIFQLYGPFPAYLHNLFEPPSGHTVLSLRRFSVGVSATTAALITLAPLIGFSKRTSLLAAISWVAIADYAWSSDSWWLLPWSPVISTALVVALLLIVGTALPGRAMSKPSSSFRKVFPTAVRAFLAGLLTGSLLGTRLLVGLAAFCAVAVVGGFFVRRGRRLLFLSTFAGSIFLTVTTAFMIFQQADSQTRLISQLREAPASYRSSLLLFLPSPSRVLVLVLSFVSVLVILSLLRHYRPPVQFLSVFPTLLIQVLVLSLGSVSYAIIKGGNQDGSSFSSNVAQFLFWLLVVGVCVAILYWLFQGVVAVIYNNHQVQTTPEILLALFASVALVAIIPSLSPRYLWWAMPLGLLLGLSSASHLRGSKALRSAAVAFFVIPIFTIFSLGLVIRPQHSNPYVAIETPGILKGMRVAQSDAARFTELSDLLSANLKEDEVFFNWCDSPIPLLILPGWRQASEIPSNYVPHEGAAALWRNRLTEAAIDSTNPILICDYKKDDYFLKRVRQTTKHLSENYSSSGNFLFVRRDIVK